MFSRVGDKEEKSDIEDSLSQEEDEITDMTSKLQSAIRQSMNYMMRFEAGGVWGAASQCIV